MSETILKYVVDGIADITDRVSGNSLEFTHEVIEAHIDGVSAAFTWDGAVLVVPSYTSGYLTCKFRLYMIFGRLSEYGPKDPETPASDVVFWEERITKFPQISGSIKDFMTGTIAYKLSNLTFTTLSGWELLANKTYFMKTTITAYLNDVLLFTGESSSSAISEGSISVNVKNMVSKLDSECNWGDPSYLNRIEGSHNSAFYNGANIPEKYYGRAIPFVIGNKSGYEDVEGQSIDAGDYVYTGFPLVPQNNTFVDRTITNDGNYVCIQVIPTGTTTGILCRIPSFQAFQKSVSNDVAVSVFTPLWTKLALGVTATILPQQLVWIDGTVPQAAVYNGGTQGFRLTQAVLGTDTFAYTELDTKLHLISKFAANYTYRPTNVTITSQATAGGNNFLTITATGCDFITGEHYLVCSDISGSKTMPEIVEFVLTKHGLAVDSASIISMKALYPQKTCIHVGNNETIPTVNTVIGELNESVMSFCKVPLDGSSIVMDHVDFDPSTSITLTADEIRSVRVIASESGLVSGINFEPRYARGTIYRDTVFESLTNTTASTVYGTTDTSEFRHCLTSKASSRWQDITDYMGKPAVIVSFVLLDTSFNIQLGDYVSVNHDDFVGIILITGIDILTMGYGIKGRFIK